MRQLISAGITSLTLVFVLDACSQKPESIDSKTLIPAPVSKTKYQRCAGSYELAKCERQEAALAHESPADATARAKKLDDARAKNMEIVNSATASIDQPTQPIAQTRWYTFDINHSNCFQATSSPADRIRLIQGEGFRVQTKDYPNGTVEVGTDNEYWTYFRSMEACIASLPRSQPIPKKYE